MAVYVDKPRWPYRGMLMCHMMADTLPELHEMADRIGLKRSWYQPKSSPHYDISEKSRELAVAFGAIEADRRTIVALIRRIRSNPEAFHGSLVQGRASGIR